MEDEHVCIDDLPLHLGDIAEFPSPGAFYGVCKLNYVKCVFVLYS